MQKAFAVAGEYMKIPAAARYASKMSLRQAALDKLVQSERSRHDACVTLAEREEDIQQFLGFINHPDVQAGVKMYLASLKKKQ